MTTAAHSNHDARRMKLRTAAATAAILLLVNPEKAYEILNAALRAEDAHDDAQLAEEDAWMQADGDSSPGF